jgi:LPS sulfotransferase NodH
MMYANDMFKNMASERVRLVIFGQGRTGSTLLESLLASTKHFRPNGEIFNTDRGEIRYPVVYIRGLSKMYAKENLTFHVKVYQLDEDRKHPVKPNEFLKKLHHDGWKILHLRRLNKVNHALSNILAEHIGFYHKFTDKENKYRIHLDCSYFEQVIEKRFHYEKAEQEALSGIPYHEVWYEKDLEKAADHQDTVNRILNYVSLENRKAHTKHQKINTQSPEDLIINYNEFVKLLKKRQWMNYLEHPLYP